ncbi:conserved domain protein [delta proteobacterium NaphS2]|nr:conserved domain protein [delta proteobacterium NaphS2]
MELLPFSLAELCGREALTPDSFMTPGPHVLHDPGLDLTETLFTGFFPRIHDRGLEAPVWLDGYVRTYIERDVHQVAGIGDMDPDGHPKSPTCGHLKIPHPASLIFQ